VVSVPVPTLLLLLILWSSKLPGEGVNVSAVGLRQLRLGHIILCHIDGREERVAESFLRAHHRSICILVCILVHHLLGLVCLGHLLQSLVDSLKDHRVRLCVVCYCAAVHIQKQLTLTCLCVPLHVLSALAVPPLLHRCVCVADKVHVQPLTLSRVLAGSVPVKVCPACSHI